MKAARVLRFGPPSVIRNDELPKPYPAAGELLVRVKAAGVGNWDALIREGRVALQPLPIVLGSELSGIVEAIGTGVLGFKLGDEVYGATNEQFSGAYAEYALPLARMIAQKPKTLNFIQAASVPIVAVDGLADALRLRPCNCWADCTHSWRRRQCGRLRAVCRVLRMQRGSPALPRARG